MQFLPPHSSDWNRIELCWAKVRAVLDEAKARTFDALVDAPSKALRTTDPAAILAWFARCGYTPKA